MTAQKTRQIVHQLNLQAIEILMQEATQDAGGLPFMPKATINTYDTAFGTLVVIGDYQSSDRRPSLDIRLEPFNGTAIQFTRIALRLHGKTGQIKYLNSLGEARFLIEPNILYSLRTWYDPKAPWKNKKTN